MEPQDFLQEYVEEVREHLQDLERSLLVLEREGANSDEISQLFRAAHSIKGASAYMGFEQIANLTHEIESLFSEVKASALEVTPKGISTLLSCVDYISKAVGELKDSGSEPSVPGSLLEALQDMRAPGDIQNPEPSCHVSAGDNDPTDFDVDFSSVLFPDVEESALDALFQGNDDILCESVEPVCPTGENALEDPPRELQEEDGELLTIFIGSFRESMDQILSALASPATLPLSDSEYGRLSGMLHRLRASCQYMDFGDISEVVLKGEEILKSGHEQSKPRGSLLREFWAHCAEPLKGHMPELELPAHLLDSPDHTPLPPREEVFQEDDEELLSIFLETFHQQFSELIQLGSPSHGGKPGQIDGACARGLLRKLVSSSQYMDYDRVANILMEWDDKLADAEEKAQLDSSRYGGLLRTYGHQLESAFPAFGPLLPPETQAGDMAEEDSILQYLEEEIDRSFDVFESAALAPELTQESAPAEEDAPAVPPVEESAPAVAKSGGAPEKTASEVTSKRGDAQERITVSAEEMPSSATLRVDAQKVDQLLNQVGELVVTRSEFVQTVMTFREMLRELATQGKLSKQEVRRLRLIGFRLHESTLSLGRVANDLQDSSMRIRMLPISHLFQRFPRIARDQALKMSKKLELFIEGGETEIDKRVLEQMHDPLVQLLRNAIAHGIEAKEERLQAGKAEVGTIRLAAYHEGDYVTLEIEDDGRGVDTERLKKALQTRGEMSQAEIDRLSEDDLRYAIFLPGLSTRESVDGNAGRGVGLDVVKENVERMNGTIEVFSECGKGTRFLIRIPLTVAIIRALLVKAGQQVFTLPLTSVTEILRYRRDETHTIEGFEVISLRGKTIPVVHLNQLLNLPLETRETGHKFTIIVTTSFRDVGLVVDGLMGEREVVIKPIEDDYHAFQGFSGATVLGDGTVSLIVDVSALLRMMRDVVGSHTSLPAEPERGLLH